MAQPITRAFLSDLMAVLELPAPVVEFGSMQVESEQDSDLRRFFDPADYTGTDFREGPGVDRVEDLRALTFEDGSIGTALCFDTLEHCEDPPLACRELARVTAPGGVCIISSVMLFGIHGYPNDYFRFTPEGFRSMLSGFDDVRVVGVGDPGIPREVFGVGVKGRSLDGVRLDELPTMREAQRRWDDPVFGVKVGPLRVPPRELAGILRREVPSVIRARLSARRGLLFMSRNETVVILCGGRGTRLQEKTVDIPKPLVEIGGRPIVWHVIQLYAVHGFRRFVLCTGYKGDLIADYAASSDWPEGVEVQCVETGLDTPTGGRIHRVAGHVGPGRFCATYADGVADIDLDALMNFHSAHGSLATMSVVRPELQFGVTHIDPDNVVTGFQEKPRSDHWINGGFFVFEQGIFDYLTDSSTLEREPLEGLSGDGQLRAFRHTGFWDCMDTYKDAVTLNDLWASGTPPWKLWD